jgi:histidine ammonia-lyase
MCNHPDWGVQPVFGKAGAMQTYVVAAAQTMTPRLAVRVARSRAPVALSDDARALMARGEQVVTDAARRRPVYGRTTGVGANHDTAPVDGRHGGRLLASHATTGLTPYPDDVVRIGLLVRLNQLARGGSGLPPELGDAIVELLNGDRLPTLHRGGALGTGDLGALAELGLALDDVLDDASALPLLSSNAITLAECCLAMTEASGLVDVAPVVGALTHVAMRGNAEAYDARVHAARPHAGQSRVAARMRDLLGGLPLTPARVQDPFGLRAFAQVLGPAVELVDALGEALHVDINAAAENPLVTDGVVLHNGNWHAMPVALHMDALRLALHSVATLSTSRLANLIDPELTGLSRFLAHGAPPSSGAMMLEYVAHDALALVRAEAQPATLGTATLSRGAEHHASFAPQAAAQTTALLQHLRIVLACELVAACRAVLLAGLRPGDLASAGVTRWIASALGSLPQDLTDRPLRDDIDTACDLLTQWEPRGLSA